MTAPQIPVPEITAPELAFGTTKALPPYAVIPDEFKRWNGNLFVDAVSGLFFKGGRLSDYGLKIKDDLDAQAVRRAIQAHLCSWEPQHEHKTAGVAMMLASWCEPIGEA